MQTTGFNWFGVFLDLSDNKLTGTLPPEWSQRFPELWLLNLAGNSLTGTIPYEWGAMPNMSCLDASRNRLDLTVPADASVLDPEATPAKEGPGTSEIHRGELKGIFRCQGSFWSSALPPEGFEDYLMYTKTIYLFLEGNIGSLKNIRSAASLSRAADNAPQGTSRRLEATINSKEGSSGGRLRSKSGTTGERGPWWAARPVGEGGCFP